MLNKDFFTRYSRHFLLHDIGIDGQKKLLETKVLIIGVGGLGSPVALYLSAAGIGTIGLVEFDTVDISNLQRQVLYDSACLDEKKSLIAKEKLLKLNPTINIIAYDVPLDKDNAEEIISKYDYVVDATDNFYVRYLISDTCEKLEKPYVYGSVFEFEGQVSVFCTKEGFTYRDLFPNETLEVKELGILDKGILGTTPGVIGCIQATEVIKLVLNIGENLIGKLLIYDALEMDFQKVSLKKKKLDKIREVKKVLKSELKVESINLYELERLPKDEKNKFLILNIDKNKFLDKEICIDSIDILVSELGENISKLLDYKNKIILIASSSTDLSLLITKGLLEKGLKVKQIIFNN